MIRHVWSVLCSKSTIDRETNNISLIEVLEQLEVTVRSMGPTPPPGVPLTAELVTLWAREDPSRPTSGRGRSRLLDPQDNELGAFEYEIDLDTAPRHRSQGRIQGLRLAGNGWYNWEVAFRLGDTDPWTIVSRVPVEISVVMQQVVVS
jgi:hypothetical protein